MNVAADSLMSNRIYAAHKITNSNLNCTAQKMTFILSSVFVSLLSGRLMLLFWTMASQDSAKNIFGEEWPEGIRELGWASISNKITDMFF